MADDFEFEKRMAEKRAKKTKQTFGEGVYGSSPYISRVTDYEQARRDAEEEWLRQQQIWQQEQQTRQQEQQNAATAGLSQNVASYYQNVLDERKAAEPTPGSSRADTLPELQRAVEAGEMHPTEALSRYLGTLNNAPAQGIQENHALTPALQAEFVRRNSGQATGTNFAPNVNLQYQMAQMANRGRAEGTNEEEVAGWVNSKAAPYQGIRNNKDYLANTKADEKYAIKGLYTATGKKAKYNYITNLNGFADSAKKSRENELSKYDFMTENERKDYTYIANTQGLDAAEGYLDYLDYDLNARASDAAQAAWAKNAQGTGNAIGASATSVLANSVSGLGTLNLLGQNINKALTGKPVDYNAPALNASKYTQTVRGQVAKDIEKAHPNATVAGVNLGSFLYQTGMSMADSAVVALLGSLGVPQPGIILGSSAAVNATLNAKERGLTDAQALTTGIASGIAEMLFEEISLEKIIHPTTAKGLGGVFKNILRQAFTEGSEEVATTLANTLTDRIINGDKSEILIRQRELQADGMDEEEARKAAWHEWWIGLATDALGGALSGGLMGTGANVSNYMSEANYRMTGNAYKQMGMTNDELRDALVNVNQNTYDPYTREWLGKLTDRAARGEDLMQKLPSAEIGKVMALQAGLTNTVLTQTEYNRIARLNESPYNRVTDEASQTAQETQRATRTEEAPLPARAENAAETQARQLTLPTVEEAPTQNTQQTLTMPTAEEQRQAQVDERQAPVQQAQAEEARAEQNALATLSLPTAEAQQKREAPQTLTLPTVAERQEQNAPQALTLPTVNSRTAETEEQLIDRLKKSDAGLAQDDYTATMDQRTVKLLDTLAKKLGLRVAFADEVNRGKANADITGNVVLIEKGNPNPVRFLIGHEATHWMKRNADGGYNAFEKAARKADAVWFQNREAEIRQAYEKQGISIDEAGIREEAIADYAGLLADNSDTLERFITENKDDRSALEKVRDFFRHVKEFLTGDERAKVERAERRLIQALQQTERNVAEGEAKGVDPAKAIGDSRSSEESYTKYSLNSNTYDYAKAYTGISKQTEVAWDSIRELGEIQKEIGKTIRKDLPAGHWRMNIHNLNEYLAKHPDIWQRLVDIQTEANEKGIAVDFVTPVQESWEIEGQTVEAGLKGFPIEYRKKDGKYIFNGFSRTLSQLFVDRMDPRVRGKMQDDFIAAVEDAYKKRLDMADPAPKLKKMLDAVAGPVAGRNIASKTKNSLQTALRSASKTVMALNFNSACPMFTVGNHGCYLDACYLTQMGAGGNTVNLFQSAIYGGEILQLSQETIDRLNSDPDGLRVNGVGDTIADNKAGFFAALRHAEMRGLKLKIITKQIMTLDLLREAKKQGIDISNVTVQLSMDNLWLPAELDDTWGSGIRGTVGIADTIRTNKNFEAASVAYDEFYGRQTKEANGVLYRKYGFDANKVLELIEEYPEINILPRYVVTTASEIAELALGNGPLGEGPFIQTLMHGVVPVECESDYPGKILNFGSVRHVIEKNADGEWEFFGAKVQKTQGDTSGKGKMVRVNSKAHKIVDDYIKEHYTKAQQETIYTNLQKQICCKASESVDACAGCQSLYGGGCSLCSSVKAGKDFDYTPPADLQSPASDIISETVKKLRAMVKAQSKSEGKAKGKTKSKTKFSLKESDTAYLSAVDSGDMETAQRMVNEAAEKAGFVDAIPEQTSTYAVRTGRPPKTTVKVYKVFTVTDDGSPTALFVSGTEKLPQNVWLNAQDTWHFTAKNGLQYVPSTQNPYTDGGKTGGQVEIPNDEIRQELIRRGFLPKGSKAKAITALAYRPGWHAGDLPFFPQGGMQIEGSNYKNVHRYNQVVFECEMDADTDYTTYHTNKDGKTVFHDMETMPDGGYYKFSTNPMANAQDIGSWYISGSLKIGRALTEAECNKILQDSGRPIQEWQQYQDKDARRNMSKEERDAYEHTMGPMNLAALGYTGERFDAARKTLAPVTYDDNGEVIPLSERFDPNKTDDIRYSLKESDSAYLSAVNSGNTAAAQRMVNEAAKKAGYTIRAYHGTSDYGFTRFDNYFTKFGLFGNGFYFTESPEVAESYTKKGKGTNPGVYSVFLKADKLIDMDEPADLSKWRKGFRDFDFDESYLDGVSTNEDAFRALKEAMQDAEMYQWEAEETVPDFIQEMGYDGITHMGGGRYGSKDGPSHRVYIVYDSGQIKSANPVTRTDIGEVIPLSERFNEENEDIRYSLKDSDSAYLSAVNSGDMETAQQMVDDAAKKAGYNVKGYHGTAAKFTKFQKSTQGKNWSGDSRLGPGFYFAHDKNTARKWTEGTNVVDAWLKMEKPLDLRNSTPQDIVEQIKKRTEKKLRDYDSSYPLSFDSYKANVERMEDILLKNPSLFIDEFKYDSNGKMTDGIREFLSGLGYDGIISEDEIVVFEPEQIKSADPVTYDDDGNIIPLSERFSPENEDIRYSLKGLDADAIPESVRRYGRIKPGEKPARDVQVPKKVTEDKNERVSQTIRTVLEAGATPDTAVPTISELVEKGAYSYQVYSDKDAIAKAEDTIKDKGWEATLTEWVKDVSDGTVNKTNTALGWALYNNAANEGDLDTALNVLDLIVRHQRNAAQAVQATRILKQLTPEAQLYGVQRSVDNLIAEIKQKYGKDVDIQVNRDLARAFLNAKTEEERRKALEALYKDVGRQLPSRFVDKWNAWRYLAMLGNPRTHVRNIVGNAGFAPVVLVKDQIGTMLESIAYRLSKGKMERTKGLVLPGWDHKLVKAAWDRYDDIMDEALGGGKYTDVKAANDAIQQGRVIFKFKPLEWARRGNSAALDKEDIWFNKPHYVYAMAQYCKANDITPAQIASGIGLEKAEAYAIKEAQKATYRDINAFSNFVSNIGRSTDRKTPVGKVASAVIEGILPFRRTPANILARGVEYSPLGLAKSLTYDMYQVMKKDADGNPRMTVAEMLDNVSAGLTGTGLLALGMLLSKLGLLRGHGEDDEKVRNFDDLTGHQNYALQLPNGDSYTLDWLAPEALPVFVGVNLYERMLKTKGEMKMNDLLKAISSISEPMLEMSMIQGINDLLETVSFAKNNETSALFGVLSEATISYLTQAFPTLLGQSERTGENVRMTTYTDKNKWLMPDLQYSLGKVSAKTPGWDYDQIPYIDAWGRTEVTGDGWMERAFKNMLNPGYTDKVRMSDMEKELLRLYNVNPEDNGGVLPTRAGRKIGETDLTGEQYVKYATKKGELSYELVTGIVKSAAYKKATDSERVEMIKDAYDYANEKGRAAAIPGYKPSKNKDWMKEMDETVKATKVSRADYISARYAASQIKGIPDGEGGTVTNSAGLKKMDYLYGLTDLTNAQRDAMMADFGVGETLLESVQSKDDVNGMLEFLDAGIPATEYKDYKIASGVRGIDLDTYMKGYNAYYDADGSGTKTNADWTAVLDKQTFSKDTAQNNYIKGVLWQLYTNSTSTKNNPYDKSGGQYVLDEKAKAKAGGSGSGSYARLTLPTAKKPWEVADDMELRNMNDYGGNVDLTNRKSIPITQANIDTVKGWGMDAKVGDRMTVASQTFRDGNTAIVVTPILPDGTLMTQRELEDYWDSLRGTDYTSADKRGIILGVFDDGDWNENLAASDEFANRLHELHERKTERRTGLRLPTVEPVQKRSTGRLELPTV